MTDQVHEFQSDQFDLPDQPGSATSEQARAPFDEISIRVLTAFLGRHSRIIGLFAVIGAVAVVGIVVAKGRDYTATSSFSPRSREAQSVLSGLASQFGINAGGGDVSKSPAFYADLVQSRTILGSVVDHHYQYGARRNVGGALVHIWKISGSTPATRREKTIERLRLNISVSVAAKTGVVSVAVTSKAPALSYEILQQLLAEIDHFNLVTRQSQAAAERRFTEGRLAEVRGNLRAAEDGLQQFMQQNRDFRNSPELSFQQGRLSRQVELFQALYTTLSQADEQAKIEEVRDTPLITLIDRPEIPVQPNSRGLIRNVALGIIASSMFGVGVGLFLEARRRRLGNAAMRIT